jgi:hypothetical protein
MPPEVYLLVYTCPHGCGEPVREAVHFVDLQAALDKFADVKLNGAGNVGLYKATQVSVRLSARVDDSKPAEVPPKPKRRQTEVNVSGLVAKVMRTAGRDESMRCRHTDAGGNRCKERSRGPRFHFLCKKHEKAERSK